MDRQWLTSRSSVRLVAATGLVAAIVAGSAACSRDASNDGASPFTNATADSQTSQDLAVGSAPSAYKPAAGSAAGGSGTGRSAAPDLQLLSASALDRAQIKTAYIGVRSTKVFDLVANVEAIATGLNGYVDSENTQTNAHGVSTSSSVTIRVPVDSFETAVSQIAGLGQLATKKVTTEDVTGRVADVNSRVRSAQDAIAQLRTLFSHATRLADIITLESQLADREADLEALQAQQRVLAAQTTLSTIAVHVSRPVAAPPASNDGDKAGFVGGLQQGWDALVTSFLAVSHALGAALPLAVTVALVAFGCWLIVRRLPRHRPDTSG